MNVPTHTPGQPIPPLHERRLVLADGVDGLALRTGGRTLWVPFIVAMPPGQGAVGRFLDGLPRNETIIFPEVINQERLAPMLQRRGFHPAWVRPADDPREALRDDGWVATRLGPMHGQQVRAMQAMDKAAIDGFAAMLREATGIR